MNIRQHFHKPKLGEGVPVLHSGQMALHCVRDCGRFLVISISDVDHFPADWICPVCDDLDRVADMDQLEAHSHTPHRS